MTNEQKELFDFLNCMSEEAKKNRQKQMDEVANVSHDMYESYKRAGFSQKQALELVEKFMEISLCVKK